MILEIAITGLTAFIRDKCAADEATKLNVLTMSGPAGMAHHPRLIIEAKYVRPSNNEEEWPDEAISLPDGTQYMIWDLTGYGVEIPNAPPIAIYEGHRVPKANPTRAWIGEHTVAPGNCRDPLVHSRALCPGAGQL